MLGDQCSRNLDKASFAADAVDVGVDVVVVAAEIASTTLLKPAGGGDGGTNMGMDVVVVAAEVASITLVKAAGGGDGGTNMGMYVAVVPAEIALFAVTSLLKMDRCGYCTNLGWLFRPLSKTGNPTYPKQSSSLGALIVRIGFWGVSYYNYNIEPPKKV